MKNNEDSFEIEIEIVDSEEDQKTDQVKAVKDSAADLMGALAGLASSKVKNAGNFVQDKATNISKSIEDTAASVERTLQKTTEYLDDKLNDIDVGVFRSESNDVRNDSGDFSICENCGAAIPAGASYCPNCGERASAIDPYEVDTVITTKARRKPKRKGLLAGALAMIVAGTGISAGVNEASKIEVPDVQGLSAYVAENKLEQAGFDTSGIVFECDDESLTDQEVKQGEYEVVSQEPAEGEQAHSGDSIYLTCQDNQQIRINAMTSCRYEKASDVLATADSYNYTYDLNDLDGNDITAAYASLDPLDQEDYYVYEQTAFNDGKRITEYTIDTKENIESSIESQLKELKGKDVATADKLAESLDFEISYTTADDSDAEDDYIITGFASADLDDLEATLKADTKEHIEEKKLLKKIAKKIPYKGLDEKYLAKTSIGKYDREEDDYDDYDLDEDETAYYWMSDDGKYDVLKVICEDGKVTKVKKLNKKVYWTASKPDFSADKDAYDAKIAAAAAEKERQEQQKETMVWIPRTGSCYHSNPYCSNMRNPSEVTLTQAQNWGYRACKKCY